MNHHLHIESPSRRPSKFLEALRASSSLTQRVLNRAEMHAAIASELGFDPTATGWGIGGRPAHVRVEEHLLDIPIRDAAGRIARPWVAIACDERSGEVLGIRVSSDPANFAEVASMLDRAGPGLFDLKTANKRRRSDARPPKPACALATRFLAEVR